MEYTIMTNQTNTKGLNNGLLSLIAFETGDKKGQESTGHAELLKAAKRGTLGHDGHAIATINAILDGLESKAFNTNKATQELEPKETQAGRKVLVRYSAYSVLLNDLRKYQKTACRVSNNEEKLKALTSEQKNELQQGAVNLFNRFIDTLKANTEKLNTQLKAEAEAKKAEAEKAKAEKEVNEVNEAVESDDNENKDGSIIVDTLNDNFISLTVNGYTFTREHLEALAAELSAKENEEVKKTA